VSKFDPFKRHQMLDRAWLCSEEFDARFRVPFDRFDMTEEEAALIEHIEDKLAELYQMIGQTNFADKDDG
jgi:hypothetical protein